MMTTIDTLIEPNQDYDEDVSGKMLENATLTTQFLKTLAHPARLVAL